MYAVDAATPLLEAFIGQVRETYQTLGLFGPEHCVNSGENVLPNGFRMFHFTQRVGEDEADALKTVPLQRPTSAPAP